MTASSDLKAFPAAIRAGQTLYLGSHSAVDAHADIEIQTAQAFQRLASTLACAGAGMDDLLNLRTYYVCGEQEGPAVTAFWNRMTGVRLRYLADPGPAATALRVSGAPGPDNLIGVDGVADLSHDRQRIMPEHAWDWTIPTPFSQGWRVADKVYVGGQISADRTGKAVAVGDVSEQTRIVLEYIRHVLRDAGQNWDNVMALRICYRHDGNIGPAGNLLAGILEVVRGMLPEPRPALTAIGVNLLYEGLLLEVDAVSRSGERLAVAPFGSGDWISIDGFPLAWVSGEELHVGGLSAPGGASFQAQVEATLGRLLEILSDADFDASDLVKLTLYYVPEADPARADGERALIPGLVQQYITGTGPVMSLVSLPGLPHYGQRFQLDAIAVRDADRVVYPFDMKEQQQ